MRKLVRFNGEPAIGLGIVKQSKANTLDVADAVHAELAELRAELPPGVKLEIAFDSLDLHPRLDPRRDAHDLRGDRCWWCS